ncbi:MAG: tryptophan-rich sensory protein, partial [Lachnospiraceae bacterium]|nr:tryptophan-rich sensory protein [Lachnospiraceae bacterium]
LFPVVWTILYILMGISSYLITHSDSQVDKTNALTLYTLQLGANFLWSILFFGMGWYFFSFLWLCLLWVLILATILSFQKISPRAAWLLVPYLLWVTFAGYLNLGIALLNKF